MAYSIILTGVVSIAPVYEGSKSSRDKCARRDRISLSCIDLHVD